MTFIVLGVVVGVLLGLMIVCGFVARRVVGLVTGSLGVCAVVHDIV